LGKGDGKVSDEVTPTDSQNEKEPERFIPSIDTLLRFVQIVEDLRQKAEREKFGAPRSIKTSYGSDQVVRAIQNEFYVRPMSETFIEFIILYLKKTLGPIWVEEQLCLPTEYQHVIGRWFAALRTATQSILAQDHRPGDVYLVIPTGELQELFALAYDVYCLQQVRKLPEPRIDRLKNNEEFQGARYEIAIAATFVRCGFEIDWVEDKSKKHYEFHAKQKGTGETIAVEAKSRHRPGVLNFKGGVPNAGAVRSGVHRLFNDALTHNPGDKPFGIFIDLNMPREINVAVEERSWFADIEKMVDQFPKPTPTEPSKHTFFVATNYAWHYQGKNAASESEGMLRVEEYSRHPLKNQRTYDALMASLANYGKIPFDE
jgi:hypothetical protein